MAVPLIHPRTTCIYSQFTYCIRGIFRGVKILRISQKIRCVPYKYRLYTEVEVSMGFINRATQSRG